MTAPAAHQSLFCHQSLVHLPAAQVDTEQLQSMTSACGSMTGNIKAKKKKKKKQKSHNFFPVLKTQSVLLWATREARNSSLLAIYMGKLEIPVGKSNGLRHLVWKASENAVI